MGSETNMTAMGPERFIDVDGIRTRYFDQGEGERTVFFHGGNFGSAGGASTARIWEPNFVALQPFMNVISVDRLGQGYTDNPKTDDDYTMHAVVQHAAGFLRALGKGPYHIVGHSRGGYVVCRLTLEYPELVKTCTIVSSGTLSPGIVRNHIQLAAPPRPLLTRESQRWVYERYSYNPTIVDDAWLDETVAVSQLPKNTEAVRKMAHEGLEKRLFAPQLAKQRAECHRWILEKGLERPTLVAWGYNDPTADPENGKLLIEMLMRKQERTEVRYFNGAGHFVFREHPRAFNLMLRHYVAANAA
jgi:2-hydroxy-6-oxonona-2,4-dienedioate hydrolase